MIKKIQQFIEGVKTEMAKVTWSTRRELINSTMIVMGVTVMFTIFIFLADIIISRLVQIFY